MSRITKDPLLAIAKGISWFIIGVMAFAAACLAIGLPFVFIKQGDILAELAEKSVDVGSGFIYVIAGLLVLIIALLVLAIWFFRVLQKIIDSVGEGDPFVPVNAARLARMAWIAIAGQLMSIPVSAVGSYVAAIAADAGEDVHVEAGIGGGGIVLVIVLFILARVFRKGAEMREELEGTV